MKKFLDHDSIAFGALMVLAAEAVAAALLALGLAIFSVPVAEHLRWFAIAFVPPLLLLRYYAKAKSCPTTLKAVVTTLFASFIIFMWYLLKYRYITLS